MADEKALVSMAQQFTGLPMDSLIGAPLNAAADANAAMAVTQTEFILNTCFHTDKKDVDGKEVEEYKPVMITMSLTRGVIVPTTEENPDPEKPPKDKIEVIPFTTTFELPLISIIAINSLGVDNVDVTFEMEVKSSYSEEQSKDTEEKIAASAEWKIKAGWGPVSASVKGSASYDKTDTEHHSTHYEKSNSAKYTVNVHAGQLPVPKGVNTIIDAFTKAIQPIEIPKEDKEK